MPFSARPDRDLDISAPRVDIRGAARPHRPCRCSPRTQSTTKNDVSSRSNALTTVLVTNTFFPTAIPGRLVIVDLAGSERAAARAGSDGNRLDEGRLINESLMTLKDCVRARSMVCVSVAPRQVALVQADKTVRLTSTVQRPAASKEYIRSCTLPRFQNSHWLSRCALARGSQWRSLFNADLVGFLSGSLSLTSSRPRRVI